MDRLPFICSAIFFFIPFKGMEAFTLFPRNAVVSEAVLFSLFITASMSFLAIDPPGPVPFIVEISILCSLASLRATGVIRCLSPFLCSDTCVIFSPDFWDSAFSLCSAAGVAATGSGFSFCRASSSSFVSAITSIKVPIGSSLPSSD